MLHFLQATVLGVQDALLLEDIYVAVVYVVMTEHFVTQVTFARFLSTANSAVNNQTI